MNSISLGILAVLISTLLAVGGMLIVRKQVGTKALTSNHEVAGYLLSIVGTLYAVLLGFVVVDAMQHTQEIRVLVEQEASSLANIFLCSNGLPKERKEAIQRVCDQYAECVIEDEWLAMSKQKYSPRSFSLVWSLWKDITTYKPDTESEKAIHQQLISEICYMTNNRRTRIVNATHGINSMMWAVLIAGGVLTVIFTYFFSVEDLKAQILMTVLVALTLSLNILLVFVFSNPFAGEFALKPDAFKLDRMIFKNFEKGVAPEI